MLSLIRPNVSGGVFYIVIFKLHEYPFVVKRYRIPLVLAALKQAASSNRNSDMSFEKPAAGQPKLFHGISWKSIDIFPSSWKRQRLFFEIVEVEFRRCVFARRVIFPWFSSCMIPYFLYTTLHKQRQHLKSVPRLP